MNFFQAIILGIVQALTEYLPVSSSAHIRIFGDLMLGSDPGAAFTAIIQIGTELAVILYFRHDIINILTHWFSCLFGKNGKDWKARMGRRQLRHTRLEHYRRLDSDYYPRLHSAERHRNLVAQPVDYGNRAVGIRHSAVDGGCQGSPEQNHE